MANEFKVKNVLILSSGVINVGGSVGTSGQVLTSTGTGVVWATPTGGGGGASVTVSDTAPSSPTVGDLWFDSISTKTYIYFDSYWIEQGTSEVSTLYTRNVFSATSSSLANNASENITISGYKSYVLMKLTTNDACWVRLYSDTESMTADESRSIGVDPVPGSGIITEVISTGALVQKMTPFVFGGNLDSVPNTNLYLRVTNLSGVTKQINIGLTLMRLEA